MKVQYVNSILDAVKKVFTTWLDMSVKFDNPTSKKMRYPTYEISSIIKIKGALCGYIVLSYPEEVAITIASEMLEKKFTAINDESIDAISEISNMVTGIADTELEMENVSYTLPTVHRERKKIEYPEDSFVFSMSCSLDSGVFDVEVALT